MDRIQESNSSKQLDGVNIRVLESSHNALKEIVEELGIVFRKHAGENGVRIIRGVKGTYPHQLHAVQFLIELWEQMSRDDEWSKKVLTEYTLRYMNRLKETRPGAIVRTQLNTSDAARAAGVVHE